LIARLARLGEQFLQRRAVAGLERFSIALTFP